MSSVFSPLERERWFFSPARRSKNLDKKLSADGESKNTQ
jgi:hypothetical protein